MTGACLLAVTAAQHPMADPLVGRWDLNVARSHYGGGAEPRTREEFVCEADGGRVKCTIQSVRVDGRALLGEFTAGYDGTSGPIRGIPEVDYVRLTRVNASIADATFSSQGRPVFAYRAVRSADRRSLTIISVDPATRAVLNSVIVYDQR
jgi:hypothetical protein